MKLSVLSIRFSSFTEVDRMHSNCNPFSIVSWVFFHSAWFFYYYWERRCGNEMTKKKITSVACYMRRRFSTARKSHIFLFRYIFFFFFLIAVRFAIPFNAFCLCLLRCCKWIVRLFSIFAVLCRVVAVIVVVVYPYVC